MLPGIFFGLMRVFLGPFLRSMLTESGRRTNNGIAQGIGMILAAGGLALGSIFFMRPLLFSSIYYFVVDGLVVLALVGAGIGRIVTGLFSFNDTTESRSGPAASPVNYYVALPEEMPVGYCWQCGRHVKRDSLICLRCGATQPKGAQVRAMMSAPTLERGGGDSGHWPQWRPEENEEEEDDPLRRLGPAPMDPGRFPGGGPYPPAGPYPGGGPRPQYPPPNMPHPGQRGPAFPLPSRPMRRPPPGGSFPGGPGGPYPGGPYPGGPGGPYPGGPFPPNQPPPGRGGPPRGRPPRERVPREKPPRERPPREKKPSRPRWVR